MDLLGMISSLIPGLGFMFMGFSEKDGGKEEEKNKEEESEEEEETEEESTIKKIQKDPDAISKLLDQKRKANKEAKESRLALKKLQDAADELDKDQLKKKGEFEKLSEKLNAENEIKAQKFKERLIENALQVEAIKLGINDPEDVKLASREGVEFDDETFVVTGASDSVAELKKNKAYLFGNGSGDEGGEGEDEPFDPGKGSRKTKIKKFDAEKTTPRDRFILGYKNKGK